MGRNPGHSPRAVLSGSGDTEVRKSSDQAKITSRLGQHWADPESCPLGITPSMCLTQGGVVPFTAAPSAPGQRPGPWEVSIV